MSKSKGSHGSARHTESRGPGPVAGAEEQDGRGPGKTMESRGKPDMNFSGTTEAASGKGIKPVNRTRGREESNDD